MSDDFDTDDKGNIVFQPVVGWDTFTPGGVACGIRIKSVTSEENLLAGRFVNTQLVLTVPQAIELAQALQRAADKVLSRRSDETPQ